VIVRVICGDPDVVVTVTVADLGDPPAGSLLAKIDNVNVPLPELVAEPTVNHGAVVDADQAVLDTTDTDVDPDDDDGTDHEDTPRSKVLDRIGDGGVAVTVNVPVPVE